jgi:hypothetical protein
MKWFKHMQDARHNAKIQWACGQLGEDAGYARLFKLYEIMAGKWTDRNTDVPAVKITNGPGNLQYFAKELGISAEETKKTFSVFAKAGLIDKAAWKDNVLYIQQLAEYSNEWFNKGGPPEGLRNAYPQRIEEEENRREERRGDKKSLSKEQYTETKIASIWYEITGQIVEAPPKGYFKKDLKELVKIYGQEEILSQFEIWASLNSGGQYKKPVSAFITQYQGTASATRNLFKPNEITDLTAELYTHSNGDITFNRLNLNGLAKLLTEFTREEIISAFKKFYSEYTGDWRWADKDFVEKAPQIILGTNKQKAEQIRKTEEMEKLKQQIQSENASKWAIIDAQRAQDERLAEEAFKTLIGELDGLKTESGGFEEESWSPAVVLATDETF